MATFHHSPATPSPSASRLLHPASVHPDHSGRLAATADVLAEIAAGLARTVTPGGSTAADRAARHPGL